MTVGGGRPARSAGRPREAPSASPFTHLPEASARGAFAFAVMAAIGQVLASGASIVADTGMAPGDVARMGWIYVGAFHHVAIELDVPDLDVSAPAAAGSTSLSFGFALLAVTAIGVWLLFRGGRAVAERGGGPAGIRMLRGAAVAPAYAIPSFVLALLVHVRTPFRVGAFASGELGVSVSRWQSLVFPLAIAAVAGAAGGLASALEDAPTTMRARTVHAAIGGGWRAFTLAAALSIAGLFVAGVVQADEPVALLTPSTARYWRAVFERPSVGIVALGHHVAALPNEALWTLVPAMGACDVVRGSAEADLLCYGRFPTSVGTTVQPVTEGEDVRVPIGDATFGRAPAGYFLFLIVPAIATVLGGRHAAVRLGEAGRRAIAAGAASGLSFAGFVFVTALLSTVVVGYGAAFGRDATAGWIVIGPDVVTGTLLAIAWGGVGGAVGAATASRAPARRPRATR